MSTTSSISKECLGLAKRLTDLGFCCFPTKNKRTFRSWGQVYDTVFDSAWSQANGCAIRTGKESRVTVIDVDNKGDTMELFDRFVSHYGLKPTTWVLTPSGGYHLYFKWTPDLKQGNFGKELDIDIRNDGGYILAPGSYYFADGEKSKYNGRKYTFKTENGRELNFDSLREVDPEFIKLYRYGIDKKTLEFNSVLRKDVRRKLTKKQQKREVSDGNKKLFVELMKAYSNDVGNAYEQWVKGVWAVCGVSNEYSWDPEEIAIAWSSQVSGYAGPAGVTAKVREWDPKKGTFNLDYILRLVSAEAKKAFSKFERTYFYHDYTKLLKSMDLEQLNQYLNTAFVRVDRMSSVMWYTRSRKGTWHPISTPFRKPNDHVFTYEVKNPKYKPNDKECKEPEMKTKATTLGSYIISNQLRHVPNYEDLQFLPFYGKDPTPRGVFNTFSGYRHEILSDEEYDPDSEGFQFIMKHWLDIMCNKNQEFCDYLMNWLGWLLRFGYKKPRTAIVMHGPPGLGKDTMFTDFLWHGILGEPYAHKETNMKRFTDRFNMKRLGKCLHIFNECTSTQHGSKVSWDAMKAIITDRDFMAEPKGKEAFQAIDCAGCILLSNHDKPCNIANNDRRYAVVSMAQEVPGAEYFKRLRSLVKSTVMQRTFMTYLVKRDISKWNMADIPQTESRNEIIDTNWENRILDFLADLVTGQESTNDVQWFNAEFNETRLKPKQRWYNSTLIWPAFDTYLKGKGFNRYTNNRVNITKKLKKAGLKIGRHTCRSWYGTNKEDEEKKLRGSAPRHAWHLDKESIQQLHRAYLSRPNWNYPE